MKMYNVYRLSDDGDWEQSLGYYEDFDEAADAAEHYCIKYPDYRINVREVK